MKNWLGERAAVLFACALPSLISAHPRFMNAIPNGEKVIDPSGNLWPGVGHERSSGGGTLNPFGLDFKEAGYRWTQELCRKDSDCDGLSNGEELGDPLCQWSEESVELPQFDVGITHPGIADLERSTAAASSSGASMNMDTCANFTEDHDLPSDYISTSFVMPSYEVPSERTTYTKYAMKVDDGEDMYAVRFDPVIDQPELVHHILLYNCDYEPDEFLEPNTEGSMPCTNLVFAWAVGGASFCLPPTLGFEFVAESPWYLIDVHYDNPNGISGVKDKSGIQVTRFPKSSVAANEGYQSASYLWVGAELDTVRVPPRREVYEVTAECSFDNIPDEGITVFSYFLHGHHIARKIWTEVKRPKFECPSLCTNNPVCEKCFTEEGCCGSRDENICFGEGRCCDQCVECEACERCYEKTSCNPNGSLDTSSSSSSSSFDLGCNTRYDFDLQETVPLQEFQKVYADDILTTHCVYDSSERTSMTYGGDATEDEMCIAFYLFYPSPPPSAAESAVCLTGDTKLNAGDGAHTCNVPGQVGYDDSLCRDSFQKYTKFGDLRTWLQVHVITMYIAWGFMFPLGVLIPMSFREAFQDESKWFHLHRALQLLGLVLLLVGCSVAFANVPLHFSGSHQRLGLALFILALFQPLNAFCRPSRRVDSDGLIPTFRRSWEIMHKNVGRITIVMGWANVILGAKLIVEWYGTAPKMASALMGVQGVIIVALSLVAIWRYIKRTGPNSDDEIVDPSLDLDVKQMS